MSGFEERFEVGDPSIGVICYFPSLPAARDITSRWRNRYEIVVFDRFARRDMVDAYIWVGGNLTGCHRRSDAGRTIQQAAQEMRGQYVTAKA